MINKMPKSKPKKKQSVSSKKSVGNTARFTIAVRMPTGEGMLSVAPVRKFFTGPRGMLVIVNLEGKTPYYSMIEASTFNASCVMGFTQVSKRSMRSMSLKDMVKKRWMNSKNYTEPKRNLPKKNSKKKSKITRKKYQNFEI